MEFKEAGNKLFQAGQWAEARDSYTQALAADPSILAALANRAACDIQLRNWSSALQDCNQALKQQSLAATLRVKVLWRKAICLRQLGVDEELWRATVAEGLRLDGTNEKLKEELTFVYVRNLSDMPAPFHASASPADRLGPPGNSIQSSPQQNTARQDFMPSLPLTYGGLLRLCRSQSSSNAKFCYDNVSGADLRRALADVGVEPEILEFFLTLIVDHPEEARNKEYMEALKASPRYEMASLMADTTLTRKFQQSTSLSL